MNSTRISIILFLLAAAVGPALLVGFHDASQAAAIQGVGRPSSVEPPGKGEAPMDPAAFIPAGLKAAPWAGSGDGRLSHGPDSAAAQPPAASADSPVLVELFTSEGCSSCPPADKLLNELAADQTEQSKVQFLAFHVDYWDHLGWKDPYASKAATERQHAYAKSFGSERVYTPQMVVGGTLGFVGSDRIKAREAIEAAKRARATVRLTASTNESPVQGKPVRVRMTAESITSGAALPPDLVLMAAIVEDGLVSKVTAGENRSRTLAHDRVVRGFAQAKAPDGRAEVELQIPGGVQTARSRVIAIAHEGATMRVLSVAVALPSADPQK